MTSWHATTRNLSIYLSIYPDPNRPAQIAPALSCFAVFDGHGGDHCARWAARELPRRCRALLTAAGSLPGMHATTVDR